MADTDQRVALVTGATRGIGAGFAHELAGRGYGLTVVGRNEQRTESLARELRAREVKVHAAVADLSDSDAVVEVFRQHRKAFGRLDVLVNNAGLGVARPIDELTDKHISLQIDLNLRAIVLAYRGSDPRARMGPGRESGCRASSERN